MDNREALGLLDETLARFRLESYAELIRRMGGEPFHENRLGVSGIVYQIEIDIFWDDREGGNVRVLGAVDDGGWRAVAPLTRSFIRAPDESFVGE